MKYTEQGWHIEYDPSITEEMFNEFVKTLSNDGITFFKKLQLENNEEVESEA